MQERFRFRVWFTPDYQEPEMIYDAEQTYDNRCRNKGSFHHESFGEVLEDKDCVVMQCTGLKDKNGKLIYEGDIISENWHKYILEWGRGDFQLRDFAKGSAYTFPMGICIEKCEIIGNIYENPELLEVQDADNE